MLCLKCSTNNDSGDLFCYKCGARLAEPGGECTGEHTEAPKAEAGRTSNEPEDRLAISATTTLAAKKARVSDVKSMRPLTQAAYNIVESERGGVYSTLISLLNILISLGIVAVIIETYRTIDLIVSSTTTSKIEGSLMTHYQQATGDNQIRLLWCVIIFIALVMAFVCFGRLSIRIQKVNRKRRRENLYSRID